MSSRLIIFAKNPIIGKTKTRISRKLGDEVALAIYYRLINKAQRITSDLPFDKVVYYSEFVDTEDSWDNSIYDKRQQVDRDLGARMDLAIREQFDEGFDKVVLIGTDIYELTSSIIMITKSYEMMQFFGYTILLVPFLFGGKLNICS